MTPTELTEARHHRALTRGALINLLGMVARLGHPLFLLVVTWLWGPAFVGTYLLAQAMMEVAAGAIIDSSSDATLVLASRHAESAGHDLDASQQLYSVLANSIRVALGLAAMVALLTWLAGRFVIDTFFPAYGELVVGIYILGAALVPRALSQIAIASTKAMLHMEHDALLNGLFHPVALLASGVAVYALGGQLPALLATQLVVEVALCLLALRAFGRYFSFSALGRALVSVPVDRKVLSFVVPQGLNLTFNRYVTRLDSIMLAAFGLGKSDLGYFATASLLTSNLAQIRMIFSGALAPVVARIHSGGRRQAFEETLGRAARWTTSLIVPVLFMVLILREDLLQLVSSDYGHHSLFVAVLLIPPFTNCAYGLAGACLMFTGHTRVTLINSMCVAVLNIGLMWFLIPRHGMLGAAIATAIATSIVTFLQMIELAKLEQVAIRWRAVWKPHVGLMAGLVVLAAVWDPARLPMGWKAALVVALWVFYGALMFAFRHEELRPITRWARKMVRQLCRRGPPEVTRKETRSELADEKTLQSNAETCPARSG